MSLLTVSPASHKYRIPIPPESDKENVAYGLENLDTGDLYVGTTERSFGTRMREHESNLNTGKKRGQRKVYKHLRAALDKNQRVVAKILAEVPQMQSLSAKEKELVAQLHPSLNGNKGGRAKKAKQRELSQPLSKITPVKSYPVKRKMGVLTAELTPSADKISKEAAVLYRYKDKQTGKSYVGQTIQHPPKKRFLRHLDLANDPEKDGADREFYRELRKRPEDFTVGIVDEVPPEELDAAEKALIREKNAFTDGYNGTQGNG